MPSVSVIIPVYNVEPYVARCARSIFEQTLEDLEIIFVDDCTPDQSIGIIKEVLSEYPNRKEQVHFIRSPRNGGLAKARVLGLKISQGDYIIHCDSDDAVAPETYRLMRDKAVKEDLDIVICDFLIIDMNNQMKVQSQKSEPGREVADVLSGKVWGTVWSRMVKRELYEGVIIPKRDMWEDVVFSVYATSLTRRIGHIDRPLYYYYQRSTSISMLKGLAYSVQRSDSISENVSILLDYLSGMPDINVTPTDVLLFKYRARGPLTPYVHIKEYYLKWRNTFPELDSVLLKTKGIPWDTKFWFILIHLHLYHPWKVVTKGVRRFLTKATSFRNDQRAFLL